MKEAALPAGIDIWQPDRVNSPESLARLQACHADVFVVAAYGQILSAKLLGLPRLGAINLHASLLPRYRGAAPIQHAIWNGETRTGVTIFQIVPQLDAGPVLGAIETTIHPEETAGELELRLADLAAPLTLQTLEQLERGVARPVPQDPSFVTLAPKITKSEGLIDWTRSSPQIACQVRAMQPWPMPYSFLRRGQQFPLRTLVLCVQGVESAMSGGCEAAAPGDIVPADPQRLLVRTGSGLLEITQLQPAGKRPMAAADFLRGHPLARGDRFGSEE
jgi:methionyl-tRNA formyltransferase